MWHTNLKSFFYSLNRAYKKGMGIATAVVAAGVLSVGAMVIIQVNQDASGITRGAISKMEAQAAAQMNLAIAAQLVANNVILCRESGWIGLTSNCKWGGSEFSPAVDPEAFAISDISVDGKKLEMKLNIDNNVKIESKMEFSLSVWTKDPNLKDVIGEIPEEVREADRDEFMVYVDVLVPYLEAGVEKIYSVSAGMRRPLAVTTVEVEPMDCVAACATSITLDPNPECRTAQTFEDMKSPINGKTTNLGPGALYGLSYARSILYDPNYFPNAKPEGPVPVQVMPATQEVIMPGESFTWTDQLNCMVFMTASQSSQSVGRGDDRAGTSETTVSQHPITAGHVYYAVAFDEIIQQEQEEEEEQGGLLSLGGSGQGQAGGGLFGGGAYPVRGTGFSEFAAEASVEIVNFSKLEPQKLSAELSVGTEFKGVHVHEHTTVYVIHTH